MSTPPIPQTQNSNFENHNQSLHTSFKSAATSITQLYKDALNSQQTIFNAGYDRCLNDVWVFLSSKQTLEPGRPDSETHINITLNELGHFLQSLQKRSVMDKTENVNTRTSDSISSLTNTSRGEINSESMNPSTETLDTPITTPSEHIPRDYRFPTPETISPRTILLPSINPSFQPMHHYSQSTQQNNPPSISPNEHHIFQPSISLLESNRTHLITHDQNITPLQSTPSSPQTSSTLIGSHSSLKRRISHNGDPSNTIHQDLTFFGKPINSISYTSEIPSKRRWKKDDHMTE